MKWISQYCSNVKYILKVDDDIVSNIFILLRHLKSLETHKLIKQKTIMCLVWVSFFYSEDEYRR
jgi:beta-1,3-galactosyltransferase 1